MGLFYCNRYLLLPGLLLGVALALPAQAGLFGKSCCKPRCCPPPCCEPASCCVVVNCRPTAADATGVAVEGEHQPSPGDVPAPAAPAVPEAPQPTPTEAPADKDANDPKTSPVDAPADANAAKPQSPSVVHEAVDGAD